ncbi:MAG: hypothetical protein WKF43_16940 [Acidimicrobiales bacterium]
MPVTTAPPESTPEVPSSRRHRLLPKFAALAFVAVATVGAMAATATPASAWSYASVSGSPGGVAMPTVYVGDLIMPSGHRAFTVSSNPGAPAHRSPASTGTQIVQGVYLVQQWANSQWVTVKSSPVMTGRMYSNQSSVYFPPFYLQPSTARGYFRATWVFDWQNTAGTYLGSTYLVSGLATDHACVTPSRFCLSYAGYVRTGGYMTNSW